MFYRRIQDLNDPNGTTEQPGIALLSSPNVTDPKTLDDIQDPDVQPVEGQYIVHDVDELVVPYLPDPMAAGFSLVFYEAGADHVFTIPGCCSRCRSPMRAAGPRSSRCGWCYTVHRNSRRGRWATSLTIGLPPGEQVGVKLSSTLDDEHLEKMGLWVINPVNAPNVPAADREVLAEAAPRRLAVVADARPGSAAGSRDGQARLCRHASRG